MTELDEFRGLGFLDMSHGPMTPQEMRAYREFLGFTGDQLAALLDVEPRSVRRWEEGVRFVSQERADQVRALLAESTAEVARLVAEHAGQESPEFALPEATDDRPGGWWRRIAARASLEVPDLRITDQDDDA